MEHGEAAALLWALREMQAEVMSGQRLTVITDHQPLEFLLKGDIAQLNVSNALLRRLQAIKVFDLVVKYRPGALNFLSDVLSRNPIESN